MSKLIDDVSALEAEVNLLQGFRSMLLIPSTGIELSPLGQDFVYVCGRNDVDPLMVAKILNIPTKNARAFLAKAKK